MTVQLRHGCCPGLPDYVHASRRFGLTRLIGGIFVECAEELDIDVEVVCREPDQMGFQVQARRWVVERTFAWLSNYRRLSKDYEQWVYTSDATIYAAMTHLMVRRLARLRAKNELLE